MSSEDKKEEMPPKPKLNPFKFPRPPLLERTPRHLQVKWDNVLIADTKEAYWVLETTHPPSKPVVRFQYSVSHCIALFDSIICQIILKKSICYIRFVLMQCNIRVIQLYSNKISIIILRLGYGLRHDPLITDTVPCSFRYG